MTDAPTWKRDASLRKSWWGAPPPPSNARLVHVPAPKQPSSVTWVYPAAAENFTLFQSAAYLTATSHMSSSPYEVDTLKPPQVGVS